ncbi:hypothetical protein FOZ70_16280 [Burkholderia sp. COPS]|uniref:GrlR family regulatory protein n=1 Tax=Burkholderia sp. COPS TaxID=2597663 RepID=UPI001CA55F6C|nr:GrlR family regulatory protein [Burkholderia sp. COPS]MBW5806290.1 hypothetical protein [Burkholderia sp. COPS]
MHIDGFYKVDFSAVLKGATGVVVVENGNVRGADDQYLYSGQLHVDGDAIQVKLAVKAYVPGAVSVFNTPGGKFDLLLTGKAVGRNLHFEGPAPATLPQGPRIDIVAERLDDISLA